MSKNNYLFTSESVSEGHPDKIADQISDAILDKLLSIDKDAHLACEAFVTTGLVLIGGEYSVKDKINLNFEEEIRSIIKDIGYDSSELGFDYKSCAILNCMHSQSSDIAMGVRRSDPKAQGAGDQGIMFGYACNETKELMPLPIMLSHKILEQLSKYRKSGDAPFLRPDAKAQATIEYQDGKPTRVDTIVLSTQHSEDISSSELSSKMIKDVIGPVLDELRLSNGEIKYHINPTGRFIIGGPHGDTGLTGRKIIVDTYGGISAHGGGAFSGKDPSKVDRSASYMGRYIAKNLVAAGIVDRCQVQLAYAIGVAEPVSLFVETFQSEKVSHEIIYDLICNNFDLTPYGIIKSLDLKRPIYRRTAAYGHFGRELPEFTWERVDLKDKLRREAKL
ncbi:MAG: methionine adenosyltransferase [Nitrospinota bacterium]